MAIGTQLTTINAQPVTSDTPLISHVKPATFQICDALVYLTGTTMGGLAIFTAALQPDSANQVLLILFATISTVILVYGLFKSTIQYLPCICSQNRTYRYDPADGMFFAGGLLLSTGGIGLSLIENSSLQVFVILWNSVSAGSHLFGVSKSIYGCCRNRKAIILPNSA